MKKISFFIICFCLSFCFFVSDVFAANFAITTNKNQVLVNDIVEATVYIDSSGISINSAEGLISFPTDLLNVISVNNSASIFPIWVEQPQYSNSNGTVSFNGGLPNPGFTGSQGSVLKILFKAKKNGVANVSFSSAKIYANDGLGTNVINLKQGASILIDNLPYVAPITPTPPVVPIVPSKPLPLSPVLISEDMPDADSWYSKTKGTFAWDLPKDVIAVQLFVGSKPDTIPSVYYDPPISKKTTPELSEGIWYFHARYKNSSGWGPATHRKIKIDLTPPEELNIFSNVNNNKEIILSINAKDKLSGIERYEIYLNEEKILDVNENENKGEIRFSANKFGENKIRVVAFDFAGNVKEEAVIVDVPISENPNVKISPEEIKVGQEFNIYGDTYPNMDIKIWIQEGTEKISYVAKSDSRGDFMLKGQKFDSVGVKQIWAEFVICDYKCKPSNKINVEVKKDTLWDFVLKILNSEFIYWPIIIFILFILLLLYILIKILKKIINKFRASRETENDDVYKIFGVLKEDAKKHRAIIDRNKYIREFLEKDEEILSQLEEDLVEAEKYFAKRIEKLKKGL